MKKNVKISFILSLLFLFVISLSLNTFAAPEQPVFIKGNDNDKNEELDAATAGTTQLKIDPPVSGVYEDGKIRVTVAFDGKRSVTSFSVESLVAETCYAVKHIFVKGGNGGNLYTYNTPVFSDSGLTLVSPINSSNDSADISHISFFYEEVPCPPVEKCYEYQKETAWGAGERINAKGNWATFFEGEKKVTLYAGQHIDVGKVSSTFNGDGTVTITYTVNENVKINEVHFYVGDRKPTHSIPGRYENKETGLNESTFSKTVAYDGKLEDLHIAAHAVVTIATEGPCEE